MVKGIRGFSLTDLNVKETTITTGSKTTTLFRPRKSGLFGPYRLSRLFKRDDGKQQLMRMRGK